MPTVLSGNMHFLRQEREALLFPKQLDKHLKRLVLSTVKRNNKLCEPIENVKYSKYSSVK